MSGNDAALRANPADTPDRAMPSSERHRPAAGVETAPPHGTGQERALSVWQLLGMLLRHRRLGLLVAAAVMLLGGALILYSALNPTYVADASFLPEAASGSNRTMSTLAAEFGLAVPGQGLSSPQLQVALVESRTLLGQLAESEVPVRAEDGSTTTAPVTTILAPEIADPDRRRAVTVLRLRSVVDAEVERTGLVNVRASAGEPILAYGLVSRLVELLGEVNLSMRQGQATAERQFVESQLAARQRELREAEDELESFLQNNRGFQNSPQLAFEFDRLQRVVLMRQEVVTSLAQGLEQARIDEVRNTPLMTVVDDPAVPLSPAGIGWPIKLVILLMAATALGALAALTRGLLDAQRSTDRQAYEEAARLFRQTREGVTGIFRRAASQ